MASVDLIVNQPPETPSYGLGCSYNTLYLKNAASVVDYNFFEPYQQIFKIISLLDRVRIMKFANFF